MGEEWSGRGEKTSPSAYGRRMQHRRVDALVGAEVGAERSGRGERTSASEPLDARCERREERGERREERGERRVERGAHFGVVKVSQQPGDVPVLQARLDLHLAPEVVHAASGLHGCLEQHLEGDLGRRVTDGRLGRLENKKGRGLRRKEIPACRCASAFRGRRCRTCPSLVVGPA